MRAAAGGGRENARAAEEEDEVMRRGKTRRGSATANAYAAHERSAGMVRWRARWRAARAATHGEAADGSSNAAARQRSGARARMVTARVLAWCSARTQQVRCQGVAGVRANAVKAAAGANEKCGAQAAAREHHHQSSSML